MCNNKTLSHSDHGYVFQCLQCERFQVAYGTSLLTLDTDGFALFRTQIKERLANCPPGGYPNHKCILIPWVSNSSAMVLCPLELAELKDLLDEAAFTAELGSLVAGLANRGA